MTKSSSAPLSVSFEFFPPKTAEMELKLWQVIERLAPLGPRFVSVTYGAGGSTRERTHSMVRRIRHETALEPAAHLTCVGASRDEIDDIVRDYWATGIRHLVALRGDAPADTGAYVPHPQGYAYAADLVDGIRRIADFEISVAAYPETHPQATSASADIDNLKRKIDAGATRAITQYFFDAEVFLSFRERAAKAGITVPVVPGIMPVTNFAQMARFSAGCGATVPNWLAQTFEGLDQDPETRRMVATSVAVDLVRKLQAEGVADFHFYTSNRAELPVAICHMLGIRAPLPASALAV
ncbi:MAG: methylenetetrahydrofolate reductase [Rhodospirillales bacterium]|jgi:methylenetetrahydrofolate reductase (NADPH)|nr:methylenetetrahydrofolate reductase [Rhodospirillales bacterium]